ncbi:MAG: hypothetical protein ABSG57_05040 [Candidatus Bathyarchaeia archaeon]
METETEATKKICVEGATYKALKELADNKNMTVEEYVAFLFKSATTFDQPEQNEPFLEVPLNAEQYAKLRSWLDAGDFIEIVTGSGTEKATVFNSQQLWRKNHPNWKHDLMGEMVQLKITVISPFLDFIKEYLRFFGCKDDVETFCMKAIYARVQSLNGDLEKFAGTHGLNPSDWLERFNERTHGYNPDEEEK